MSESKIIPDYGKKIAQQGHTFHFGGGGTQSFIISGFSFSEEIIYIGNARKLIMLIIILNY